MEAPEEKLTEAAEEVCAPEAPAESCDFLEKYASAAFHDLAIKRGRGEKEAAEKIRRYVRHIEKKDADSMEKYLHTANDNENLETLRKAYCRMQTLSWLSLILCAIGVFSVIGIMVFKPELLQKHLYQWLIVGGALFFAVLTWVFSGIGSSKARRMTELDLLLRVKDIPTEEAEEVKEALEEAEEAAEEIAEEAIGEAAEECSEEAQTIAEAPTEEAE